MYFKSKGEEEERVEVGHAENENDKIIEIDGKTFPEPSQVVTSLKTAVKTIGLLEVISWQTQFQFKPSEPFFVLQCSLICHPLFSTISSFQL